MRAKPPGPSRSRVDRRSIMVGVVSSSIRVLGMLVDLGEEEVVVEEGAEVDWGGCLDDTPAMPPSEDRRSRLFLREAWRSTQAATVPSRPLPRVSPRTQAGLIWQTRLCRTCCRISNRWASQKTRSKSTPASSRAISSRTRPPQQPKPTKRNGQQKHLPLPLQSQPQLHPHQLPQPVSVPKTPAPPLEPANAADPPRHPPQDAQPAVLLPRPRNHQVPVQAHPLASLPLRDPVSASRPRSQTPANWPKPQVRLQPRLATAQRALPEEAEVVVLPHPLPAPNPKARAPRPHPAPAANSPSRLRSKGKGSRPVHHRLRPAQAVVLRPLLHGPPTPEVEEMAPVHPHRLPAPVPLPEVPVVVPRLLPLYHPLPPVPSHLRLQAVEVVLLPRPRRLCRLQVVVRLLRLHPRRLCRTPAVVRPPRLPCRLAVAAAVETQASGPTPRPAQLAPALRSRVVMDSWRIFAAGQG